MRRILAFVLLALTALTLLAWPSLSAAQAPAAAGESSAADQAKFDEVLTAAIRFLHGSKSYRLQVVNQWTSSAGATGAGRYSLTMLQPGQVRVEAKTSSTGASPDLIFASDGRTAVTYHPAYELYSQVPANSPTASIAGNKLLQAALAGSSIDILLNPQVGDYVHSQVSNVKYAGVDPVDNVRCHRFQMQWGQYGVELWIAAQGAPLLKQFIQTSEVVISPTNKAKLTSKSSLSWKIGDQIGPEEFTLKIAREAKRVTCIYNALAGCDAQELIGQQLPEIEVQQLDGARIKLAPARDKQATVLIFWATWAAPSTSDMPAITKFVKENAARGIAFYAVNVGEDPALVRRFAIQNDVTSAVVLDPAGAATHALHVGELPSVVVFDRQGKIASILSGDPAELKQNLARELSALLGAASAPGGTRNGANK